MADDFTKLSAAVTELGTAVTAVQAEVALLKAGSPSNQPTIDNLTSGVQSAVATLNGLLPQPLSVTPNTASVAVGAGITETATLAGGVEPYSVLSATDGLSATVSGTSLSVSGTITAAGEGVVTVGDASSPQQTVTYTVTAS